MIRFPLLLLFFIFLTLNLSAQDSRIAPLAIDFEKIDLLKMERLNNKTLISEEMELRKPGRPNHFAHTFHINQSTNEIGTWSTLSDGSVVWRLRIHSEKARSLNLGFSKFRMPSGGTMVIYTPDLKNIMGPFTPADNDEHEQLWTPVIDGDEIIVEVWLKENNRNNFKLELKSINHDFIGINSASFMSGSCNLDVICGAADGWGIVDDYRDIIQSVAFMQLDGVANCTGFLVNNTNQDCTPLFMTADHCGVTAGLAPTLVTYWNFENSTCREPGTTASGGNGDGMLNYFNSGSVLRATYTPTDFTIVELDDPVNPSAEAFRAGWNASETLATSVIGIHHPGNDEKRISFEQDPVYIGESQGGQNNPDEDFIIVGDWDIGTTEGGSSGSPLFDQNKRIIGQLFGGLAACGNNEYDAYGWFNRSWEGGGTPDTRLKDWIDPSGSGILVSDGKNCNTTVVAENIIQEICAPSDAVYQLTVSDNFTNNVALTLTNLPTGLVANFSNNNPAPGEIITLTISNTSSQPFGNYTITLNATDGIENSVTNLFLTLFDTIPAMTNLSIPLDLSMDITTIPTFEWVATSASTYAIEVATDSNFSNIVVSNVMLTDAMYTTPSFLDATTTYFWRIRGNNLCGNGEWSNTSTFTTSNVICSERIAEDLPIIIDEMSPSAITSTIEIATSGIISDINVNGLMGIHTWVSDLTFILESPEGTSVVLISDVCEDNDNFNINFDDQSTGSIPCPYTDGGTYPPVGSLADFNGENAQGTWTLTVEDDAFQDGGSLNNWGLEICSVPDSALHITPSETNLGSQYFELMPNPTHGNLTIKLAYPKGEVINGEVYHINGNLLDNFKIPFGQSTHNIDLSNFPAGMYVVKLKHANFIATKKVVLN